MIGEIIKIGIEKIWEFYQEGFTIFGKLMIVVSAFMPCSLRDRTQVEQLIRYIVEEAPEEAEKKRSFK